MASGNRFRNARIDELVGKCQQAIVRRDGRAALPLARRLVSADGTSADYHNLLGLAEQFSGNFDAAETAFRRSLRLDGPDGGVLSNLGVLYMGWKRYADAVAVLEQAVSLLGSGGHAALFNLAQCQLEMRRPEAAIDALERAVALAPGYLKGWKELALARRRKAERDRDLDDIDAALRCYERIAAAEPGYPSLDAAVELTWNLRAEIELDRGEPDAAIRSCVRSDPASTLSADDFTVVRNGAIDAAASDPVTFEDARVLPGGKEWFVLAGDTLYARCMASTNPATSPYVEVCGRDRSIVHLPDAAATVSGECFLLGGSDNYFHWLIDYLPRLAVYARHERFDDIPLLTSAEQAGFQRDSLRLLGIGEDRLIRIPDALSRPQVIRCDRLYAAPVLLDRRNLKPEALRWLRGTLAAACISTFDTSSAPDERIYVSRRDAGTRRVINEQEVTRFLRDQGFRILVAGELPLAQQVAAFTGARVIVGAHGAGLSNMVFAPPGARVIEFMGGAAFQQGFMRGLAESCGHRFDRLFCQPQPTAQQREKYLDHEFDMFVSLDALRSLLSA